jgi:hypothetical protein
MLLAQKSEYQGGHRNEEQRQEPERGVKLQVTCFALLT